MTQFLLKPEVTFKIKADVLKISYIDRCDNESFLYVCACVWFANNSCVHQGCVLRLCAYGFSCTYTNCINVCSCLHACVCVCVCVRACMQPVSVGRKLDLQTCGCSNDKIGRGLNDSAETNSLKTQSEICCKTQWVIPMSIRVKPRPPPAATPKMIDRSCNAGTDNN